MKKRLLAIGVLTGWSVILIKVLVFKDLPDITIGSVIFNFGGTHAGPANLMPFTTILPYLLGKRGFVIAFINIAGNIVLLIPIGFLVPYVIKKITWKKTIAFAIAAGLCIEGMQALFHVGIFDIDDILLNATGVMFGYRVFLTFANAMPFLRPPLLIITTTIVMVIAATMAFFFAHVYQHPALQERLQPVAIYNKADAIDKVHGQVAQGPDPCGGTGGTGKIVSVGNNAITIKLNNDVITVIHLTTKTKIKNSLMPLALSDLKIGDGVTVVIDGGETATLILVCNTAVPKADQVK